MPRVACCQVELSIDQPTESWARVVAAVREAARQGADVVVLPELCTSGYVFTSTQEARAAAEDAARRVDELVALSAEFGIVIVAGAPEPAGDDAPSNDAPSNDALSNVAPDNSAPYNGAVVIDGGAVCGRYRKVHLWGQEPQWFAACADAPLVVDTTAGRIGVMVCYDLEFPEWVRMARQAGAELICAPVNWPHLESPPGERPLEIIKAQAAAGAYRVPIAIADRVGRERDTDWIGGSAIIGSDGYLRTTLRLGAPYVLVADVDPAADTAIGPHNDAFADRRPHLYREP